MSVDLYRYVARTADGTIVRGSLRASSAREAAVDLRRRMLFVTALGKQRGLARAGLSAPRKRDLLGFFRALATLVRSGVTIRRALGVTIEQCGDRRLRESLSALLADIEEGSSLSAAFSRRPREFSPLHVAMIAAGESGGVLERVLDRIAELLEHEHALTKRIQSALAYPAVVAAAAALVIGFLLLHIVPTFATMFERFGVALPLPTRVLLGLGSAAAARGAALSAVAALGAVALFAACRSRFRRLDARIDRARFALPMLGPILRGAVVARVVRMLGLLGASGVSLLAALDVTAPVAGSVLFATALETIADGLRRGETLTEQMRRSGLFEPFVLALVAVGEETGRLDEMLLAAARHLETEGEAALAALAALVEPLLIVLLGIVVGAIVLSVFLPLYTLLGAMQ